MHKIFKYTKHPCLEIWANDPWERQCPVLTKSCVFPKTQLDSQVSRRSHLIPFGVNSYISSGLTQQMLTSHPYQIWRRAGDPAPVGGSPGLKNYWAQQSAKASPSSSLHPQV